MMFEIVIITLFCAAMLGLGNHYFGWTYSGVGKVAENLIGDKAESNLNQNSLTLMSIGSTVGIGIGLIISSLVGGSMLFGIIIILIGLGSLKKNWILCIQ